MLRILFDIMPTIEIVCLGQQEPFELPELPFALRSEREVISHRGLFYEEFKQVSGCIYHLGNPDRRDKDDWFFASQLVNWQTEEDGRLEFLSKFAVEVRQLTTNLLKASPVQKIIFSSDYQFGPEKTRKYERPLRLETFWRKHDAEKIWLNARYFIIP